jgi:stalled ribosome alternative rescue factor ArfA
MAKRRKKRKKRNPEAQVLGTTLFRQRIVPKKDKPKDIPPNIKEWG